MSLRSSAAIVRNDLRLVRRDPAPWVIYMFMPILLMAFVRPAYQATLVAQGYPNANGAEQAVPGMAMMFTFFLMGTIATTFFREHGWNTWERLRASPASMGEIMIGKIVVPLVAVIVQLSFVFVVGGFVFGLHVAGSYTALALVAAMLAVCLVALSFIVVVMCRTLMQLNIAASLGALLLAGLGGALTPVDDLPAWAGAIAPATPGYWAMSGFREVILDGGGVRDVLGPLLVLLAMTVILGLLATFQFREDTSKVTWA